MVWPIRDAGMSREAQPSESQVQALLRPSEG